MASSSWHISGEYMETCNCALLCPCITSNLSAKPTEGDCQAAVAMRVDKGAKDGVVLDGLSFVVMLHAPGPMSEGNITVGLIIEAQATQAQVDALTAIATGAAGGPMAALGPLVGSFAGIERRPVEFSASGLERVVRAGDLLDQSCSGLPSAADPAQAIVIDNVAHPVNSRIALARATRSLFNAFGMRWNDSSGTRNGHFAPFSWSA
ncbi:DUF1326 domain-containing protein [Roseateles sp. DAIF2]|uniref:DUF1326 domain-containing protein n=1 Tax=Roseateles sp. DAIF2 TaxID=2714952 RepID=UPI0018A2A1A2|nr:DUF1326 domain-containing protein [Roseateles sp. DAIF2]QPF76326.1 DUF1326 domain-containing protein [Roseateles sp. DAIF2]